MIRLDAVLTTPPRPPTPSLIAPGLAATLCLAATLALAGCAGGPNPAAATLASTAPGAAPTGRAAFPPPDLVLAMADGTTLPARVWLPPPGTAVRRAILALHGFNDSRDAWALPAPVLAAAGFAVVAPDQRGFGATASRGRWPGAAALVADARDAVRAVHARFPGVPLTVMGESMGGAVALLLATPDARPPANASSGNAPDDAPGDGVDSTVLLAPAVWDRAQIGPVLTASLWAAAGLAPAHEVTGRELPLRIAVSDNRDALLALIRDPLTLRATRLDVLAGLVDLMDRAAAAAPRVRGRVLILDGGRDQIVPLAATAATWARLPASARRGFYPAGFHLLLRDRERALPTGDILAWLDRPQAWLPSGADVAAAAWTAGYAWAAEPAAWLPAGLDTLAGEDPRP
jgi:acylglycerol lipase